VECIASRDAIAVKGSNEYDSYIDCGQGFLWEINDGKVLFAKLLPNETKIESKKQTLEEWIETKTDFDGTWGRNKTEKKPTIQINTQEETKIQIKFKKSIKI
jgi:hypothetical protein